MRYNTVGPRYMRTFYLRFGVYAIEIINFRGTHPPIFQRYWSRYMQIRYMPNNFLGPYLSHITRATFNGQ